MRTFGSKYNHEGNELLIKGNQSLRMMGARGKRALACCLAVCALFGSAYAIDPEAKDPRWRTTNDECTEYLPKSVCKVTIKVADVAKGTNPAPTHADVAIRPRGSAGVILTNASPLMNCTLAASPAPLSRDASSSITTFISTLATFGVPGNVLPPLPEAHIAALQATRPPGAAGVAADKIDAEEAALEGLEQSDRYNYGVALRDYQEAKATVMAKWKYSYPDDGTFATAAKSMHEDLRKALADPLPGADDWKAAGTVVDQMEKDLENFHSTYTGSVSQAWYQAAKSRLAATKSRLTALPSAVQFLNDLQALLKPAFTQLNALSVPSGSGVFPDKDQPWTTIYLPMSVFGQKQVTEAVTCKDVASQNPAFDTITFTAYYEPAASWDLSAAAFLSLLPGRQLGTITGPQPAGSTFLGETNHGSVQFIPGAVFELHPGPLNFRLHGVKDGTGYHPWGYVGSIGPAVGFLVNPNNGTTQAEFFEGISLGIHRLAILIGNHTGRYQEFGNGYYVGEMVSSGVAPPITHKWTNHVAIGIAYRIPVH